MGGRPRSRIGRGAPTGAVPDPPRRVLLATPALPIGREILDRTIELARPGSAKITVLGVARVYGTSLGFPNPGLQPNRRELDELRGIIEGAADRLRAKGFDTRTVMSKSRNAAKMIARWVNAKNFHAVVVPDPVRPRWRRAIEGDVANEIGRRCGVPVFAVPVASGKGSRSA